MNRLTLAVILFSLPAMAQHPEIFDVSNVVVGSQRLDTTYALAQGKWSDAGKDVGLTSAEIHCYKRFSFCESANAYNSDGQAWVNLESYDVLRWDDRELIAVDSSPICLVNTLRFDFANKKVSLSSTSKGVTKDKLCNGSEKIETVFLTGLQDELKRIDADANKSKK